MENIVIQYWQIRIEKQALGAYINSSPVVIHKRCMLSRNMNKYEKNMK